MGSDTDWRIACFSIQRSNKLLLLFWLLDGYYLSRERSFIKLYNQVRIRENKVDFSMDIKHLTTWKNWPQAIFSKTLVLFYGGLLISILLINFCF
jgi:hypothetical protein